MRARIYTYHRHLSVAMSWIKILKFTRFRLTKTKRLRRYFIMSVSHRTIGHFPDVDYTKNVRTHVVLYRIQPQNYYKNLKYARILAKKCRLFAFFALFGV